MMAVQVGQPLSHNQPQPEKNRNFRVAKVTVESRRRVQKRLLKHIRGVDTSLKPPVHPQLDHPAQPVMVGGKQLAQGRLVPAAQPVELSHRLAETIVASRRPHLPLPNVGMTPGPTVYVCHINLSGEPRNCDLMDGKIVDTPVQQAGKPSH